MLPVAVLIFSAPSIAVAPMRVEQNGSPILELRADGTIVTIAGRELGRIEDDDLLLDGTPVFRVRDDGMVRSFYFYDDRRFDDDDALVLLEEKGRRRFLVDDVGELVVEEPSGERHATGIRVTGATRASRRAAVLLAFTVVGLEQKGHPPPPPRVTFTFDLYGLAAAYVELASELRIDGRFSVALHSGGGLRWKPIGKGKPEQSTAGWELGVEPRWFVFHRPVDLYLAWSTRFARARTGPIGFESWFAPPGLSTGPLLGWKMDMLGFVADMSAGTLFPLVTPASEPTHPPAAFVVRLGVGFSL